METGEEYVVIIGTFEMLMWCVECWVIPWLLLLLLERKLILTMGQEDSGWIMLGAEVQKPPLISVVTVGGECSAQAVRIEQEQVLFAEVWQVSKPLICCDYLHCSCNLVKVFRLSVPSF